MLRTSKMRMTWRLQSPGYRRVGMGTPVKGKQLLSPCVSTKCILWTLKSLNNFPYLGRKIWEVHPKFFCFFITPLWWLMQPPLGFHGNVHPNGQTGGFEWLGPSGNHHSQACCVVTSIRPWCHYSFLSLQLTWPPSTRFFFFPYNVAVVLIVLVFLPCLQVWLLFILLPVLKKPMLDLMVRVIGHLRCRIGTSFLLIMNLHPRRGSNVQPLPSPE